MTSHPSGPELARRAFVTRLTQLADTPHADRHPEAIDFALREAAAFIDSTPVHADLDVTLREAIELLCTVEGSIDSQTYDEKKDGEFDLPDDYEYHIIITALNERNLGKAVSLLEQFERKNAALLAEVRRLRDSTPSKDAVGKAEREACAEIALAIDSGRGNEKEIARAIRSRTTPEGT